MNATPLRQAARALALAALALLALAGPALGAVRLGTPAGEALTGTNGKDAITGAGGNDVLKGLAGDDIYLFANGWGTDTLVEKIAYRVNGRDVPGGADTLSFRGVTGPGVQVFLIPQWRAVDSTYNRAKGPSGEAVDLGSSFVENVVGSPDGDFLVGGGEANRLTTGGGPGELLYDNGGWDDGVGGLPELPASDDAYVGVAADTGLVAIIDWGGDADVVDLRPLRSDEVVLNRIDCGDGDAARECLQVVTGTGGTGQVVLFGHFGAYGGNTEFYGANGRIEELRFADRTVSFAATARTAGGQDGEALLGEAITERQQELAKKAPALAAQAREQARHLPDPSVMPTDRGR